MKRTALAFLPFMMLGCVAKPPEARRVDSVKFTLPDGEAQLEASLHQVDLLDAELTSLNKAPGAPIARCSSGDEDVMARRVSLKISLGVPTASELATEVRYFVVLQEAGPAELMPIVQLMMHYKEGLLKCARGSADGEPREERRNVVTLVASNFDAETRDGYVLVDFMTHWCEPCKAMAPDLEKIAIEFKDNLKVGRLNVDRNRGISEHFDIRRFPTLIILKNGKEAGRLERRSAHAELRGWVLATLQGTGETQAQ